MKEETALDWFRRSQASRQSAGRKRPRSDWWVVTEPPERPSDPDAAARHFFQGNTGISYLDAAWRVPRSYDDDDDAPDILLLEGPTAKTWTLRTLVARFLVSTRPNDLEHPDLASLPQVIILDSTLDWAIPGHPAMAHLLRSTLLRRGEKSLDQQVDACLSRMHIVTVDSLQDWVPVLQVLSSTPSDQWLSHNTSSSWLVVWDGLPAAPTDLPRAWGHFVASSSSPSVAHVVSAAAMPKAGRRVQRILLQPRSSGKDCLATVVPSLQVQQQPRASRQPARLDVNRPPPFAFSISLGGILS